MNRFIGKSPCAQALRQAVAQAAGYRSSVLVLGESGTGKELIARAIHAESPRANAPLIAVDCTAIPHNLFPSQLFGHIKGAFSGAICDTLGMFRAADGGTIFLDEIGELSLDLQAQLLRVIQERVVTPVGSHENIPVDVRIIAATNRDLAADVQAGRFRMDLYYRLNVVQLQTSSLRERREDIELLCEHFLCKLSTDNGLPLKRLATRGLQVLMAYDWPGNVRELQNVLERAVVFSKGEEISVQDILQQLHPEILLGTYDTPSTGQMPIHSPHFPAPSTLPEDRFSGLPADRISEESSPLADGVSRFSVDEPSLAPPAIPRPGDSSATWPTLEEHEREVILATLQKTAYNQRAAARLLDIDRGLLARKMQKHNIPVLGKNGYITQH